MFDQRKSHLGILRDHNYNHARWIFPLISPLTPPVWTLSHPPSADYTNSMRPITVTIRPALAAVLQWSLILAAIVLIVLGYIVLALLTCLLGVVLTELWRRMPGRPPRNW